MRTTVILGVNNRLNETLGITVGLNTSQDTNFIKQILSFLAHSGRYTVKILNETSFHMWWMVRFEVEKSACVSGFPVNFGDRCHLFPDDQNIQKGYPTV
jgi:hypothetical protein